MSKTSILTGLILSVLGHAFLFWDYIPGLDNKETMTNVAEETSRNSIKVANIQVPKPSESERPKAEQTQISPPAKMEKVVKAQKSFSKDSRGEFSDKEEKDSIPSLRLVWDNPQELIAAQQIGLKILAVEKGNQILGELDHDGTLSIKPYQGDMSSYSNRVRTISYDFFGRQVLSEIDRPLDCWYILIPAEVDRKWLSVQRQAILDKGLKCSEVAYVEARLIKENHRYQLIITKIVQL